jgi:tRNA threonylcarbamoyl adenosine modification protein YeaZ
MTDSAFSFQPSAVFLALDTATDRPTLALGTSADPGADAVIAHRHDLSGAIDRVARELFTSRGIAPSSLSGVIAADGPGSFTGLRIGIAFAKGLARALDIPMLAAPSLLGAARGVSAAGVVVAEYGALRGDVYRAVYRFEAGRIMVLSAPALVPAVTPPLVEGAFLTASDSDASAAALLGMAGLTGGPEALKDPASWEPSYGRRAEAEVRLLARDGPG